MISNQLISRGPLICLAVSFQLVSMLILKESSSKLPSYLFDSDRQCGTSFINVTTPMELKSPYHPFPYKPNTLCRWIIQVPFGYRIRIVFDVFDLEESKEVNCEIDDSLIISDILSSKRFCRFKLPFNNTYISRSPLVKLLFKSNQQIEKTGFKLIISREKITCGNAFQMNSTLNYFSNPEINSTTRNVLCAWQLKVKEGKTISLSCDTFHLKNSRRCSREALIINHFGDERFKYYSVHCNKSQVISQTSKGNRMLIYFFSDLLNPSTKFKCKFKLMSQMRNLPDCGDNLNLFANPEEVFRIVGGERASADLPMVGIWRRNNIFCGGVLIDAEFIITAAHCVMYQLRVYPKIYIKEQSKEPVYWNVRNILIHEHYDGQALHDIALIQVYKHADVKYGHWACIPPDDYDLSNKTVQVFGWGKSLINRSIKDFDRRFRKVAVPVTDLTACKNHFHSDELVVTDFNFCAGSPGKDSCSGDSGGPAFVIENNSLTVAGLVSFGEVDCGDFSGVYVKLSCYRQWILNNIENLSSD